MKKPRVRVVQDYRHHQLNQEGWFVGTEAGMKEFCKEGIFIKHADNHLTLRPYDVEWDGNCFFYACQLGGDCMDVKNLREELTGFMLSEIKLACLIEAFWIASALKQPLDKLEELAESSLESVRKEIHRLRSWDAYVDRTAVVMFALWRKVDLYVLSHKYNNCYRCLDIVMRTPEIRHAAESLHLLHDLTLFRFTFMFHLVAGDANNVEDEPDHFLFLAPSKLLCFATDRETVKLQWSSWKERKCGKKTIVANTWRFIQN